MRAALERVLARYGQEAILYRGELCQAVRAFLQPVTGKQWPPPLAVTPLGAVCEGRWQYIGPAGFPLSPGDRVDCGGLSLTVRDSRDFRLGDEILYIWALLGKRKEAAG